MTEEVSAYRWTPVAALEEIAGLADQFYTEGGEDEPRHLPAALVSYAGPLSIIFRITQEALCAGLFPPAQEVSMTENERSLLLLVAEYVERQIYRGIGSVSGAKQDAEEFTIALNAVRNEA